jgi:hypothetical protein
MPEAIKHTENGQTTTTCCTAIFADEAAAQNTKQDNWYYYFVSKSLQIAVQQFLITSNTSAVQCSEQDYLLAPGGRAAGGGAESQDRYCGGELSGRHGDRWCTALHCTVLHCSVAGMGTGGAVHCTALYCTALHCRESRPILLPRTGRLATMEVLSVSPSKHSPSHNQNTLRLTSKHNRLGSQTFAGLSFTQMINDHALHCLLSITFNLFYGVYLYMSFSITCCNETQNRHTIRACR